MRKRDAGIHVLLDVRPSRREQGKDDTTGHLLRPFPFRRSVRPSVYHRIERGKSEKVEDFSGYAQAFEEGVAGLLGRDLQSGNSLYANPYGEGLFLLSI